MEFASDVPPEEGIVGVWKYAHNEEYREYITEAITDPGAYVDLYYEFYEDGTGKTYLSTDDNEMTFTYTYDGETLIGEGTHTRFIVNREKFLSKL